MKKAVLFDFDGTLVDTNEVVISSFEETYRHYLGASLPREKIIDCFGEPLLETLKREIPNEDLDEVVSYFRNYQLTEAIKLIKIFPGIVGMLSSLKTSGIRLAVVTSRTRESTLRYMNIFDIEQYFEVIVSCDDTAIHKPEPEPVYLALKRLGLDKEDVIMVGDGPFDVKCANSAGVDSALVGWKITASSSELVPGASPKYEFETPEDLVKFVCE